MKTFLFWWMAGIAVFGIGLTGLQWKMWRRVPAGWDIAGLLVVCMAPLTIWLIRSHVSDGSMIVVVSLFLTAVAFIAPRAAEQRRQKTG